MKHKTKKIVILSLFTLILGFYLASDLSRKWKNRARARIEDINIPVFPVTPGEVTAFEIVDTKFVKLAGKWLIDGTERIPADPLKVNYFLTYLQSLKKVRVLDQDPSIDYGFRGTFIKLNDQKFVIGTHTFNPDTIYLKHPSGKVFVITADILDHLKTKIVYWFDKEIGSDFENIVSLSIRTENRKQLFLNLKKQGNQWFYISRKKKRFEASNESIEKLILGMKNLRADMILYDHLFAEKSDIISLTIRGGHGNLDKYSFFMSRPEGFIEESCFYNKNNASFNYQVKCSIHAYLKRPGSGYIASTHFEIPRNDISLVELRTRQYIMRLDKQNPDNWNLDGRNVAQRVHSLFDFFENLFVLRLCEEDCKTRSDLNTLIMVTFFNDSGERVFKFLFNFHDRRAWFHVNKEKTTYFIPLSYYEHIGRIIDRFTNY